MEHRLGEYSAERRLSSVGRLRHLGRRDQLSRDQNSNNPDHLGPNPRVLVMGTTGSGKTTVGRRIAERLGVPFVELDALNWGPNWTEMLLEEFRHNVAVAASGDAWVIDGNSGKARDITLPRATTVVWLDYPF